MGELDRAARAALVAALGRLGLEARAREDAVELAIPGMRPARLVARGSAIPAPGQVTRLTDEPDPRGSQRVLVADELAPAARRELDRAGWGWLDRRGHLKLRIEGAPVVVDAAIDPLPRRGARTDLTRSGGVRGRGGLAYAAGALLHPDRPARVRQIAAWAGLAPSSVSEGRKALVAGSLVSHEGRPVIPELFWAVVEIWRPAWVQTARAPEPATDARRLEIEPVHLDRPGWALTDTLGAAGWGAPIVAASDYPPELYVPTPASLDRALAVLGEAGVGRDGAAAVAVAPLPGVGAPRYDRGQGFPVAHPLFVALDVARDPSRGREVLDGWTPDGPDEFRRVW